MSLAEDIAIQNRRAMNKQTDGVLLMLQLLLSREKERELKISL